MTERDERNAKTCDARLSRSARHLWLQDALPYIKAHVRKETFTETTMTHHQDVSHNVELWRQWKDLADAIEMPSNCRLHPRFDESWWQLQEEYQLSVGNLTRAEQHHYYNRHAVYRKHLKYYDSTTKPILYRCSKCGKTFTSRFYLDLHMLSSHQPSSSDSNSECWGDIWCSANQGSRAMCERQALLLEPHYGPGGYHDFSNIEHQWQQKLPPCMDVEEQQRAKYCYSLLQTCFSHIPTLLQTLNSHVCQPNISCQSILTKTMLLHHHAKKKAKFSKQPHYEEFLFSHPFYVLIFLSFIIYLCYQLLTSSQYHYTRHRRKVTLFTKISKRKESSFFKRTAMHKLLKRSKSKQT